MNQDTPIGLPAIIALCALLPFTLGAQTRQSLDRHTENDFTQYVDPFIGTADPGHMLPGATYPLGMVQLSPDTGNGSWSYCAGYQYTDLTVDGFSHTHMSGGGSADLGDILILPFTSESVLQTEKATQTKAVESASPGYYKTALQEDNILAEFSVTERTGIHRYTYLADGNQQLLISIDRILWSWGSGERGNTFDAVFSLVGDRQLNGSYTTKARAERQIHFAIQFDRPFLNHRFLDSAHKKLVLDFGESEEQGLIVRVGISTVNTAGAMKNLRDENLGQSFEEIRNKARFAWNEVLSRVQIKGDHPQMTRFYTSLYHLFIQPNNMTDVDGQYRGADDKIHQSPDGHNYSMIALWDIFRAAIPLYSIIAPESNVQFMNSLLRHHEQAGYLPVWGLWNKDSMAMIGNHGVIVLWDAIQKRLPGIDKEHAFRAIKDTLTKNHWRKHDWTEYDPYGYFPSDGSRGEAVSRTLETSFDDWCAAQLAKELGYQEDYDFFSRRSRNYRNLFDPETGFFRGRLKNGAWNDPFDPMEVFHAGSSRGDYTEGNAWQWLWSVQHDIPDLIRLLGGEKATAEKLDTLFSLPPVVYGKGSTSDVSGMVGQYAHGNEPSHHVIYLYNYVGKPHRTQELVRQMLETKYQNTPFGLSGNDDYGQMSAWYILSSLGFYPVNPASGFFDLGIPLHPYAKIRLNDRTLEIRTTNMSEENKYVKLVTLNGRPLDGLKISYQQIMAGGELVFEMADR
jgi:predicted alpha-1,2-mannosidase